MFVRRIMEKEVNCCGECPYCEEIKDMGATIFLCMAKENGFVIGDISNSFYKEISKYCPLK